MTSTTSIKLFLLWSRAWGSHDRIGLIISHDEREHSHYRERQCQSAYAEKTLISYGWGSVVETARKSPPTMIASGTILRMMSRVLPSAAASLTHLGRVATYNGTRKAKAAANSGEWQGLQQFCARLARLKTWYKQPKQFCTLGSWWGHMHPTNRTLRDPST